MDVSHLRNACLRPFLFGSSPGVSGEEGAAEPGCRCFLTPGAGIVSWLQCDELAGERWSQSGDV